jgi:GNAT superfamily N-acetyltransferase
MIEVRELLPGYVAAIPHIDGGSAWHGGERKWSAYWEQHQQRLRVCLVAVEAGTIAGYGSVVWRSQHGPFAAAGIPEIQDVVVAEGHRGRGIATAIIAACEAHARSKGHCEIGVGFGLYADYGSAQRLYVRLGYVPDGSGVTWNKQTVKAGDFVRVDDELILWLRKKLN